MSGERYGRFEILVAERRLLVDGEPVALGSRAFDLIAALVARRERVVPKEELIGLVWPGLVVEDNNLNVQISALRKVLGAAAIATVPGRGFQFTVAASAPKAVPPPSSPPGRTGVASRASKLLVVDDNKVNRLLLCRSLQLMGHEVASVDNGRAALAALRAERYDLLLLDLEMPEVDGYAVLEARAADPLLRQTPVIVTSSVEGIAQVARCIELGADDYLHKPVNAVLLKARVDSSLERKHLRDREQVLLARVAPELAQGDVSAGATRHGATVLCARLQGYDALAATMSPQEAIDVLGNWSTLMLEAIEPRGGRVTQFGGDGLGAVFDDAGDAARAALEMVELAEVFNAERAAAGKPALVLRMGLASGEVAAGWAGTATRAAYVCIGDPVHRAADLVQAATKRQATLLLDEPTRSALPANVQIPG